MIASPADAPALGPGPVEPLSPERFMRDGGQRHLVAWDGSGRLRARCTLWTQDAPRLACDEPVGTIGHYAAADESSSRALLRSAVAELARAGCRRAIGPMDGSTWRQYRLPLGGSDEPPFFMEPDAPLSWAEHFQSAGFNELTRYSSAIAPIGGPRSGRIDQALARYEQMGIHVRDMDRERFEQELAGIYAISLEAFAANPLFTPIDWPEFLALYEPLREQVRTRLVLLAEQDGEPVGFCFALPDLAQVQRGDRVDRVILKTVAVRDRPQTRGLGTTMLGLAMQRGAELGCTRAIFALMHQSNRSQQIAARFAAEPFRQYALFTRPVLP